VTTSPGTPPTQTLPQSGNTKECPYCGEQVLAVAKKCKHCGEIIDVTHRLAQEAKRASERRPANVYMNAGGGAASAAVPWWKPKGNFFSGCNNGCFGLLFLVLICSGIIVKNSVNPTPDPTKEQADVIAKQKAKQEAEAVRRNDQEEKAKSDTIRANFDRIQVGMTLDQVQELLGPGKDTGNPGSLRKYAWKWEGRYSQKIEIKFRNNLVDEKTMYGMQP